MTAPDPARYTAIGHRGMPLWHPHDPGALERLIDAAGLDRRSTALDIGCGAGEVALRLIERTGAAVEALDPSPTAIALARAAAARRDPEGRLTLVQAPFDPSADGPPVDLAICIGSTHAAGGLDGLLAALRRRVRPGGCALVGDGFWAAEPSAGWLERFFGGDRGALAGWSETLDRAAAAGWTLRAAHRVSPAGLADYEARHRANIVAWSEEAGPGDAAQAAADRARSDAWHAGWLAEGRAALGFGLWLFERPKAAGGGAGARSAPGGITSRS